MEAFKELKSYLREHYYSHDERSDLYVYFIEQEHDLLGDGGKFGMIVSNKFLRAKYGQNIRARIAEVAAVERIVDLAGLRVFGKPTVRTIVLITTKGGENAPTEYSPPPPNEDFLSVQRGTNTLSEAADPLIYLVGHGELRPEGWTLLRSEYLALMDRLVQGATSLLEVCGNQICRGIVSGLTDAFVISAETRAEILRQNPEAEAIIRPFLQGRNIRAYQLVPNDEFLIYTHHGIDMSAYPAVLEHLRPFRKRLESRATKQNWYELQQPQYGYVAFLEEAKIVFPDIATTCRFALDTDGYFGANTVYFLPLDDSRLLGLLNSRLSFFYFKQTCAALEGAGQAYLRFFGQYLENFPVVLPKRSEKPRNDRMVELIEEMLSLHKDLAAARTPQDKTVIQRQIDATDRQIDRLVYELYGLTDKEIAIVEGTTM